MLCPRVSGLNICIVLYVFSFVIDIVESNETYPDGIYDDSDKLYKDMFANYNTAVRPVYNQSDGTVVNVTLGVVAIQEFDEVLGHLTVVGWVSLLWYDERLQWNASDYGGVDFLMTDSHSLWTPILVHINTVDEMVVLHSEMVYVQDTGLVRFLIGRVFETSCPVDITRFPYDVQTCRIEFSGWGYTVEQVRFKGVNIDTETYYLPSGTWDIIDTKMWELFYGRGLSFALDLERRPYFIILNVCLPVVAMSLMSVFVFFIPAESGERISFSLTVLLSLAVFLTIVGQTLPKTSDPMSVLSICLAANLLINVLVTMAVIFNLRLYFRRTGNVGSLLSKIVLHMRRNTCQKGNRTEVISLTSGAETSQTNGMGNEKEAMDCDATERNNDNATCTWADVSFLFDIFFFVFFLTVQLSALLAFVVAVN